MYDASALSLMVPEVDLAGFVDLLKRRSVAHVHEMFRSEVGHASSMRKQRHHRRRRARDGAEALVEQLPKILGKSLVVCIARSINCTGDPKVDRPRVSRQIRAASAMRRYVYGRPLVGWWLRSMRVCRPSAMRSARPSPHRG